MFRRFATVVLSVLMLATLTGQGVSAAISAGPATPVDPASIVQPIDTVTAGTVISADVAEQLVADATRDCVFCVLSDWRGDGDDNVFTIDRSGKVRVDGDIAVNGPHIDGATCVPTEFRVCGTAIHLYYTGGTSGVQLSARTISISGGWTSNAGTRAHADALASPCVAHPDPTSYAVNGFPTSNICIGAEPIVDPLNLPAPNPSISPPDAFTTPIPQRGVGACPNDSDVLVPSGSVASPAKLSITGTTLISFPGHAARICPGLYPGGFSLFGDSRPAHVTMIPGVYLMLGGGFAVAGSASITGDGVMIYNTSANSAYALPTEPWTGTLPPSPCTGACPAPTASLTGPASRNIETTATYTFTLTPASLPRPTGTVAFYNGDDLIPGCEAVALTPVGVTKSEAGCDAIFHGFGTQWITAVYGGDAVYNSVKGSRSTLVTPNALLGEQNVEICTGPACGLVPPCAVGGACTILLSAPRSGSPYAGLLIFQDRSSIQGVLIRPGAGLPACVGTWMTDGVAPDTNPVPDPCGSLGGLSGTIYAPHVRTSGPGGWDATVELHGSGVTNLRVIAARIGLISESARFTYGSDLATLTDLGSAEVWIGLKNSDDAGTNFDLLAEVFENNEPIGSGQVDNVSGGGSGFNRAVNRSIALALSEPRAYGPSDKLSIRLSVRVATAGHRSGTARLWYNDAGANSLFDATINGIDTMFYLRDGFVLGTSPAPVTSTSKKTIDIFVDRLAGNNAWKTFGTWTQ